jgi:hypothetical protein
MTTLLHARLLPLAIAGLLLAGCAAHREDRSAETDEAESCADVAREAVLRMLAAPPPSPPATRPCRLAAPRHAGASVHARQRRGQRQQYV